MAAGKIWLAGFLLSLLTALPAGAQRPAPAPATPAPTMPLTDVLTLAKPYPNLISVIRLQLLAAGKRKQDVACTANRIPGTWPSLDGTRTAPYVCPIGNRKLTVTAEPTFYDKNGYKLKTNDPNLAMKAARLAESKFKWTWK